MNVATPQSEPHRKKRITGTATHEEIVSLSSEEVFNDRSIIEMKKLPWDLLCLIDLADKLVREGIRYRLYKRDRTLSLRNLVRPKRRLSCSEFIWYLLSLAGWNMGNAPVSSKRMAFRPGVYAEALEKVSDLSVHTGDILVYTHSRKVLKRQKETFGKSQVGHVVMVVSTRPKIVVGSHGLESTSEGGPIGVGYRRMLHDWDHWTKGRPLQAVYRIRSMQKREA